MQLKSREPVDIDFTLEDPDAAHRSVHRSSQSLENLNIRHSPISRRLMSHDPDKVYHNREVTISSRINEDQSITASVRERFVYFPVSCLLLLTGLTSQDIP